MLKKTAGILSVALLAINSCAAIAESKFAIAGVGAMSCGKYLRPEPTPKEISDGMTLSWVQGFLSGTNTQRAWDGKRDMKVQPDPESITAYIEKYCRDNPLSVVYQAAMQLEQDY